MDNIVEIGQNSILYNYNEKYILKQFNCKNDFIREVEFQNKAAKYKITNRAKISTDSIGFVMKKYKTTLLNIFLDNEVPLEEKEAYLEKVRDLLEVLVKEARIVHGDTHLNNFMITFNKKKVKLIDFGNAEYLTQENIYKISQDFDMFTNHLSEISENYPELIEFWEEITLDFSDNLILDHLES